MIVVIDTNVLVYCHDPRDPEKQRVARDLVRRGLRGDDLVLTWQTLVEFFSVATSARRGRPRLLSDFDARQECQALLDQFPVLLPEPETFHLAVQGQALHGLAWWDALLWAYAERGGAAQIASEDFQHGRKYGGVEAVNPFL